MQEKQRRTSPNQTLGEESSRQLLKNLASAARQAGKDKCHGRYARLSDGSKWRESGIGRASNSAGMCRDCLPPCFHSLITSPTLFAAADDSYDL
ncbi:hypothetical protein RRG08_016366 [Elysia crispata]|uniref:Uncharacterized protein n=1 Tax=Elysia crispata TaxID=231223 RepID=A0AAE1AEK2_9GAST|nr:hypothetical protein RRG08_016366 [Elysia crispata]